MPVCFVSSKTQPMLNRERPLNPYYTNTGSMTDAPLGRFMPNSSSDMPVLAAAATREAFPFSCAFCQILREENCILYQSPPIEDADELSSMLGQHCIEQAPATILERS